MRIYRKDEIGKQGNTYWIKTTGELCTIVKISLCDLIKKSVTDKWNLYIDSDMHLYKILNGSNETYSFEPHVMRKLTSREKTAFKEILISCDKKDWIKVYNGLMLYRLLGYKEDPLRRSFIEDEQLNQLNSGSTEYETYPSDRLPTSFLKTCINIYTKCDSCVMDNEILTIINMRYGEIGLINFNTFAQPSIIDELKAFLINSDEGTYIIKDVIDDIKTMLTNGKPKDIVRYIYHKNLIQKYKN